MPTYMSGQDYRFHRSHLRFTLSTQMMIVAVFFGLSVIVVVTAMPHSNDIDDLRFDSVISALRMRTNSHFWLFTQSLCSEYCY